MKKRLAIFDFCDTLIQQQTTEKFMEYVLEEYQTPLNSTLEKIRSPLKRYKVLPSFFHKRVRVLQMRGLPEEKLNQITKTFFEEQILPYENQIIQERVEQHRAQGDTLIIASGGFTPYVKMYGKYRNFHYTFSSDLKVQNGYCSGFFQGKDCLGYNKVHKLKKSLNLSLYDLANSTVYSDSMSDKPLFDLVSNRYFVESTTIKKI